MAYQEHDDSAYAGDAEGPASSFSPTAASFRRRQSSRNRDVGLFAGRLRQNQPPTKHEDTASDVEPLGFDEGAWPAAHDSQQQSRIHTRDNGRSSTSSSGKTTGRTLLGSPRTKTQSHKNKFDFDDSLDEGPDGGDLEGDSDHDGSTRRSSYLPPLPQSPTSPTSPRWPKLANGSAVYSYSGSSFTTGPVPLSSLHTSIASVGFSTAPTSPVSPSHSTFAAKSLLRSPSSSSSTPRFAGLSSHPFVSNHIPQGRASTSTDDSLPPSDKPSPFPDATATAAATGTAITATETPSTPPPPLSPDFSSPPPPPQAVPNTMIVGNFSRPRKPSVKQGSRDALPAISTSSHTPDPVRLESPAPAAAVSAQSSTWPRERARGMSVSSHKSSSTYSSVTDRPSTDNTRPNAQVVPSTQPLNTDAPSPGLPRPPVAYSRTNSTGSNNPNARPQLLGAQSLSQLRDPTFARADEETRSSYRSQWTSSTANKTVFTETSTARSSMLTKASSHASMAWYTNTPTGADDGLSVDDVMGLYEKGFGDSTGAEDNDGPYGGTASGKDSGDEDFTDAEEAHDHGVTPSGPEVLASGLIDSQILEAISDSLPIPPSSTNRAGLSHNAALDTSRPIRYSGLSSSVPKDSGFGLVTQHMNNRQLQVPNANDQDDLKEKRDSAKMLESDDKPSGNPSPLSSPQLNTSFDSRPGSAKAPSLFARAQDEPDDPGMRDRYGFRKHNQYITREQYDAWNAPYTEYIGRRRRKWVSYLRDSGLITDKPTRFPPPSVKTKRFIRKGIPPEWRGAAWFYYAGGPSIIAKHPGIYNQLLVRARRGEAKAVDIESIERDLHRTFPDNVAFQFSGTQQPGHGESDGPDQAVSDITVDRPDEPKIVSKLRRVLLAFSIYNPRIGYCQSLNFLAGLLLLFVETEEHCFWLLNVITRIFLPGTHEMSLEGSKVDLGVLMAAMQESLPGVWAKIGGDLEDSTPAHRDAQKPVAIGRMMKLPRVGGNKTDPLTAASAERLPPITLCMTAWFMSCFIGTLPIETTLRVWDVFFYEGSKTLFRVALAIFKLGEPEIRAVTDPMEMFGVVQGLPRHLLDCNMLMEATFRRRNGFGHLSQESIEEKRRERRDAFKEARADALAATDSPKSPHPDGHDTPESSGQGDATVRRKGTLFGRRRDRHPTEVM
ncbi:GTPase activating protein [Sporothrix schenckii 1099-18]|uniref:GTPase activating protein n=1 Tax=Sporothrix schenckii 1099-18 TaxID=1397361 RepID=A0A0F2MET9_SPOSC|nr:GTPase activating protein [Sporothrix schenckii 1099-18]KJR88203.1 GTPase activating protein [Sporothrix schenckii 1099-18]